VVLCIEDTGKGCSLRRASVKNGRVIYPKRGAIHNIETQGI
jgi:hypothetical protein